MIGGFNVGDVIARPDRPKDFWRVVAVAHFAFTMSGFTHDDGVQVSVSPCRKDGRADRRKGREGWNGPAAGYEVVGRYEGDL